MAVFQPLTPIFWALSLLNRQALLFLVQFGAVGVKSGGKYGQDGKPYPLFWF